MYPVRLDEKGRLKVPTVFQQYFNSLPEKGKLFVTSLDGRIGQIYPIAGWRENQELFEQYREDPEALQDLLFNAQDLGSEVEMDSQGRITINPELRKELDLQGQELHLYAYKNRVEILTEAIYQERKLRARPRAAENVRKLEMAGMK
jgi:DNA-binding transcriptional regulator/RsmH inhibitor MraZ